MPGSLLATGFEQQKKAAVKAYANMYSTERPRAVIQALLFLWRLYDSKSCSFKHVATVCGGYNVCLEIVYWPKSRESIFDILISKPLLQCDPVIYSNSVTVNEFVFICWPLVAINQSHTHRLSVWTRTPYRSRAQRAVDPFHVIAITWDVLNE